jgi:hypothetical protein
MFKIAKILCRGQIKVTIKIIRTTIGSKLDNVGRHAKETNNSPAKQNSEYIM